MLHPITVTEASRTPRAPSPRKLQKARSQRRPTTKDRERPRTPLSSVASSSARKDSVKTHSPGSLNSTVRSSFSTDSSARSPHTLAPHSLRVDTKGALLTSGFAYHPGLFDLKVHAIMWDKFTNQIVDTARLSATERAKVWAIGTAAAVTTSSPDSHQISRNKSQRIQEEKVKEGLKDKSEDSLGDLLRQWNEGYFAERGLIARLDVDEAAPNSASRQNKTLQREAHWSMHKEDRERVRAGRKFSIVITQMYEPEDLPDDTQEPRASGSTKGSLEHKNANEEQSLDLPGFRPLPEFALSAHPLMDVMADFSNFDELVEHSDERPAANQVAELEGDENQIMLEYDSPMAELPAVELQERTVKEYRDLVGRPESDEVEQQPELEAPLVGEAPSSTKNQPLFNQPRLSDSSTTAELHLDEAEGQRPAHVAVTEQQVNEDWPLPQRPNSNGILHEDQKDHAMTADEQSSTDAAVSSESVMAQKSHYKLFPRPHSLEQLCADRSTSSAEPGDECHHKAAVLLGYDEENVVKPMASPSASFFLPLDIKPVSTTLDFDPQLAIKDMATAH